MVSIYTDYTTVNEFLDVILKKKDKETTEIEKRIMAYILYHDYSDSYIKVSDILQDMYENRWFTIPFGYIQKLLLNKAKNDKYGLLGK